jgi:hypothetical protein
MPFPASVPVVDPPADADADTGTDADADVVLWRGAEERDAAKEAVGMHAVDDGRFSTWEGPDAFRDGTRDHWN